ncbi:cytochrome P450 78A7-like [Aristolochia californica]|uniref:cytochrome P450 78A7-like n=1 Tax=Aristolochia californica TaxID=171875 RepID=UPI0035D82BE6
MEVGFGMGVGSSKDTSWWVFTLPAFLGTANLFDSLVVVAVLLAFLSVAVLSWAFAAGGTAWKNGRNQIGRVAIPGARGLPVFGSLFALSHGLAHRSLAAMTSSRAATKLMAFSLGSTPFVVSSDPVTAKEILTSPHFADRPLKESAKQLMFARAIGFAPNGEYWRMLRRVASSHLFSPCRILAHEAGRQKDSLAMLASVAREQSSLGVVLLRPHLQAAALNNFMGSVFGKRYDPEGDSEEARELKEMVKEGFELLGAFNWSDFLPWLNWFHDPFGISKRCAALVPRVQKLVKGIIDEHKAKAFNKHEDGVFDFVDVLLSFDGAEKLEEDDMVAVLWELIYRGTDTTALLTEWAMAELVLNQDIQAKLQEELDTVVGPSRGVTDADMAKLPYLQAVVKESLRVHPPGPLLSWARLSTSDVHLSNGMVIPARTTAMVNMWAITHDEKVWTNPLQFNPDRFLPSAGGENVDVRGNDLRLAPFGAGRRVCPGKNLGLATVNLWIAKLVHHFKWVPAEQHPIDLGEVLKLSCEMKKPLHAVAVPRNAAVSF